MENVSFRKSSDYELIWSTLKARANLEKGITVLSISKIDRIYCDVILSTLEDITIDNILSVNLENLESWW